MPALLTAEDYRSVPWKNGQGLTHEIVRHPAAGEFLWRVSRAIVPADGPFSSFPGCDRWIVPVTGAGMRLRHDGGDWHDVVPLEIYRFAGDAATECVLIDGEVEDFNLIVRRDAMVDVIVEVTSVSLPLEGAFVIHVLSGRISVGDVTASEGQTITGDGAAVLLPDDGTCIAVVLKPS